MFRAVRRAVVAALLLLAGGLAPAAQAQDTVPAYGVGHLKTEWLVDAGSGSAWRSAGLFDLELMAQSNIGYYRARFRQDQVVDASGGFTRWGRLDDLVTQASLRGVSVQPILIDMPGDIYRPPVTSSARNGFADFGAAAAKRYGSTGSLWASCSCPKRPIRVWEIWNEENTAPYWSPPNASAYGALVKTTRSKIRKADSTARILVGGLALDVGTGSSSIRADTYLRDLLLAVGSGQFDAVAMHTYRSNASTALSVIERAVTTLKQNGGTQASGAPRHQVWLNEFGRPTFFDDPATEGIDERQQSEEQQSAWLKALLAGLEQQRAAWNLGPLMWYAFRDHWAPTSAPSDDWRRLGLRRTASNDTDAGPKLAWESYVGAAAQLTSVALPKLR